MVPNSPERNRGSVAIVLLDSSLNARLIKLVFIGMAMVVVTSRSPFFVPSSELWILGERVLSTVRKKKRGGT